MDRDTERANTYGNSVIIIRSPRCFFQSLRITFTLQCVHGFHFIRKFMLSGLYLSFFNRAVVAIYFKMLLVFLSRFTVKYIWNKYSIVRFTSSLLIWLYIYLEANNIKLCHIKASWIKCNDRFSYSYITHL